ncbi:tetratricopeptide repeat protein [Geitlerinema sp. PCC 9228]|uniref:tetratricopeptide repeat protein n=1 Tax=Geitlerinema sp. PCC 9228 TaxID=111611 RepID=UPI0008F9B91D|nr:tetratricopeptide repeat protein [Geitlerinema sp. PCC 9228]
MSADISPKPTVIALIQKAKTHCQQQNWQAAIDAYREAIQQQPEYATTYLELAKLLQQLGKIQQAANTWWEALKRQPEWGNTDDYLTLGNLFVKQQSWSKAIACYQQAIASNPQSYLAHHNLGEIYSYKQQWQAAISHYQQAIAIHPNFPNAYNSLGKIFASQQNWQAAADCYRQAWQRNPNFSIAKKNLILALVKIEQWQEATDTYQQQPPIEEKDKDADFYFKIGYAFAKQQLWSKAIDTYQTSISLNSQQFWVYQHLAKAYIALEKWDNAAAACRQAIALSPQNPHLYKKLAGIYEQQKQWHLAIETYWQAIHCNPNLVWSYVALGKLLLQRSRWQEAEIVYQKALAVDPQKAILYNKLGIALHHLQRWEEAVAAFHQAIELEPQTHWYYQRLGDSLCQLQRWQEAIAAYEKAIERNESHPWLYHKIGDAWYALQNWEQAALAYQKWEQAIQRQQQPASWDVAIQPIAASNIPFCRIVYDGYQEGGLCNRLRVLASCLSLGYFWQIPVYMRWLPVKSCHCYFEDIYQPICKTVEADIIHQWLLEEASQTLHITKMTADMGWLHKQYLQDEVSRFAYDQKCSEFIRSLKLQPNLQNAVDNFIQNNWQHPIIGLHVRRTDNYKSVLISNDDRFIKTIERYRQQGVEKFFLATDNGETQAKFKEQFGNRILTYSQEFNPSQLRQTSQQTAAIDLHLLAKTQKIVGSYDSSFSQYAATLGNIPLELPWENPHSEVS